MSSTTPEFSDETRLLLASVLDEIIPPREDGRLPGAGEVGVAGHVEQALRSMPDLRAMIVEGLMELDGAARRQHPQGFAALSREEKVQLLNQQAFVLPLSMHTYVGYYQHPRVVEALGIETRAPHPKGYAMAANDFTLLDPVRQRPRLYRL